jgi:hypothetical protein
VVLYAPRVDRVRRGERPRVVGRCEEIVAGVLRRDLAQGGYVAQLGEAATGPRVLEVGVLAGGRQNGFLAGAERRPVVGRRGQPVGVGAVVFSVLLPQAVRTRSAAVRLRLRFAWSCGRPARRARALGECYVALRLHAALRGVVKTDQFVQLVGVLATDVDDDVFPAL